jgi:uncharacterized membrane protein
MDPGLYNEWKFVSLSPFPGWVLGGLAAAALLGILLATMSLSREARPARRRLLLALRLLSGAALLLILFEPGKRLMQTTRVKNRMVVLLDRSASMGFPVSPGGPGRLEAARDMLRRSRGLLSSLATRFNIELYAFDRDLQPLELSRMDEALTPRGGTTDLVAALRQAVAGGGAASGRKLSGVVVISDGADNAELSDGLTPRAKGVLRELAVPVSTIAIGANGLKDLAIDRIAVDDFAFVRNTIEVEATIRVTGFDVADVPVVLKREGRTLGTQTVRVSGDGEHKVVFSFAPDQTGQFVLTVAAPVFADEAVPGNNAKSFVLKVIRDRVRVLLVVGRPSWDVRFLRGLLKQDPNIDLISFFILRGAGDDPHASEHELSLIPFPVKEIFHDQLRTFDLVVFQNFAHADRAYQMGEFLKGMRDYIHDGGAFVMIGGENSFGEGRYDRTELQDALPVESTGVPPSQEPFRVRLTPEGQRHPVTAVGQGEAIDRLWGEMPDLVGLHVTRVRPGARVLLDHPFLTEGGKNAPVVALWDYGRGRVLSVLADSTWGWSLGSAAQGGSVRAYDRFWNNAIRWLVKDPDLTPVRVAVEKPGVEPAEPVVAVVSARQLDYGPAAGAEVELELVNVDENRVVQKEKGATATDGTVRFELVPPRPGPYKLLAQASKGGVVLGKGEDAVAVRAAGPELSDAAPHPEILRAIADATGGSFHESPAEFPEVTLIDPETVEVGRRKDLPVWDRWYFLTVIAAAIGVEWALRRRWGYA